MKTIDLKFERIIPAGPAEVFDAWLGARVPGSPWQEHDELILQPHRDGLWYWKIHGIGHYGRFLEVDRPGRLSLTWVASTTLGWETTLTTTFEPHGQGTRMTLVHTGLPDNEGGRGHEEGWTSFLETFARSLPGR